MKRSLAGVISCEIFVVNAYNIIHKQQYVGPFESERSMPYTDGHETSFQMCENDIFSHRKGTSNLGHNEVLKMIVQQHFFFTTPK